MWACNGPAVPHVICGELSGKARQSLMGPPHEAAVPAAVLALYSTLSQCCRPRSWSCKDVSHSALHCSCHLASRQRQMTIAIAINWPAHLQFAGCRSSQMLLLLHQMQQQGLNAPCLQKLCEDIGESVSLVGYVWQLRAILKHSTPMIQQVQVSRRVQDAISSRISHVLYDSGGASAIQCPRPGDKALHTAQSPLKICGHKRAVLLVNGVAHPHLPSHFTRLPSYCRDFLCQLRLQVEFNHCILSVCCCLVQVSSHLVDQLGRTRNIATLGPLCSSSRVATRQHVPSSTSSMRTAWAMVHHSLLLASSHASIQSL